MNKQENPPLVQTIEEKCRMCYTCVRECPAKAIRIVDGQAQVITERCIGCGNCVRVCSQKAKKVLDTTEAVKGLLKGSGPVSACLAPSFPAAFPKQEYLRFFGALKQIGFDYIHEVGFGADLVAAEYRKLFEEDTDNSYIATSCPALVNYIVRYHPDLCDRLAPIVSPMEATSIALRRIYGKELETVFIGPCIAKKDEVQGITEEGKTDAIITFTELTKLFQDYGVDPASAPQAESDPPRPHFGALFPISGGMLQAAGLKEDLVNGDIVSADGRTDFVTAIKEFAKGDMRARLLEVLCCNGCIMGSGIEGKTSLFERREAVSRYVRERVLSFDEEEWKRETELRAQLNLRRLYAPHDCRMPIPSKDQLETILRRMGKTKPEDELNCGACGYETCQEHATAVYQGLAESEMCLPNTIEQLNHALEDLAVSNTRLAKTQEALLHSEKLAGMGQLAAGIAHELNNPLGVVLMYANLLKEEQNNEDLDMIAEQAERCKKIVSGLLHFARQNKVIRKSVNTADIVQKSLHSLPIPENIIVSVKTEGEKETVSLDEEQLIQVITNCISNACDAMPEGGRLELKTVARDGVVAFIIRDSGKGIPEEVRPRIFDPFFTTKEFGKGTGLGLAVSHGIVTMHSGTIEFETNTDPEIGPTGTTFTVSIPDKEE